VFDAYVAEWVSGFVRCTVGGTFQGRVGAGFCGMTGGDQTGVVFSAMLLCADGAGRFLRFAKFHVVPITLTVTAMGSWGPRKIFGNMASAVTEDKCVCTKAF
jgi:hypothetical protein